MRRGHPFGHYDASRSYISFGVSSRIHNGLPQTIQKLCSREFAASFAIFPHGVRRLFSTHDDLYTVTRLYEGLRPGYM